MTLTQGIAFCTFTGCTKLLFVCHVEYRVSSQLDIYIYIYSTTKILNPILSGCLTAIGQWRWTQLFTPPLVAKPIPESGSGSQFFRFQPNVFGLRSACKNPEFLVFKKQFPSGSTCNLGWLPDTSMSIAANYSNVYNFNTYPFCVS